MIKILKEGKVEKPTKVIYTAECPYCDCKFEFEAQDAIAITKHIYDGTIEIKCPCCKRKITLLRQTIKYREEV